MLQIVPSCVPNRAQIGGEIPGIPGNLADCEHSGVNERVKDVIVALARRKTL